MLSLSAQKLSRVEDKLTSASVWTLSEGTNGFVVDSGTSRVGLGCNLIQHGKVIT